MGRIKDLIKSFIEPIKVQNLPELALAAGIDDPQKVEELKKGSEGISWTDFSGENKKTKGKGRSSVKESREQDIPVQHVLEVKPEERNNGEQR